MSETPAVEEDYDRNDLGCAQRFLEVDDAPLSLVFGRWLINPVKKAGGSVDMIEGEDPIDRVDIGRYSTVKELR